MMTVKHVSPEGNEALYPATEVSYSPLAGSTVPNSHGCVWYQVPETREIRSIEGGTVYVMNEAGATVAKYRMTPET